MGCATQKRIGRFLEDTGTSTEILLLLVHGVACESDHVSVLAFALGEVACCIATT